MILILGWRASRLPQATFGHAFSVKTDLFTRDPWAMPTAIAFHAFSVNGAVARTRTTAANIARVDSLRRAPSGRVVKTYYPDPWVARFALTPGYLRSHFQRERGRCSHADDCGEHRT